MISLKLSICLATLNRGNLIGETLESIICQATDEVEIVVLDGASTDNTQEVIRKYQERFPRLSYFRQNSNKGVDHDFAEAVRLAKGEYCWLFSDDDLLKPKAIQTVLDAIKGQYELIIANAEVCSTNFSTILERQRLALNADRIYGPSENHRLMMEVGSYLTFIGCVIIKRDLWNAREKEKYFGSFFIHVAVIFQSPLQGNTLVIARPLISIRFGNETWREKYFEIWMFKWPSLIWSFEHCPEAVRLKICKKEPWRRMKTLFHHRAKGTYSINLYLKWLEPRFESFWTRAGSKAIAYFPGRIANFIAVIYLSLFHRGSLELIDMTNSPFYFYRFRRQRSVSSAGTAGVKSAAGAAAH